jgi:hypothetical protein
MALAMLFPSGERGRGKIDPARKSLESSDFSVQRLRQARQILEHSRALAKDVFADRVRLDKALEQIKTEQQRSMGGTVGPA